MFKISYENQITDNPEGDGANSGLLSIDTAQQHNYTDYTELFTAFIKNTDIALPDLSDSDLPDSSDNTASYNKIINSILEDIITHPENPDNQHTLARCLDLLTSVHQNGERILSASATDQLVKLLTNTGYQKHDAVICEILAAGKYELSHEQNIKLNEAAISTQSCHIIKLLLSGGNISNTVIDNITNGIMDGKAEEVQNYADKEQLLIIAEHLKSNELLKEQVLPSILKIFRLHKDEYFVSELVKLIDDRSAFSAALKEISDNLNTIAILCKISHKTTALKEQHNNKSEILAIKSALGGLLKEIMAVSSKELKPFVQQLLIPASQASLKDNQKETSGKSTIINTMWRELDIIKRAFTHKIPLTEDFLITYEKYLDRKSVV